MISGQNETATANETNSRNGPELSKSKSDVAKPLASSTAAVLVLVDTPIDWDRRVLFFLARYRARGCSVDVRNVTDGPNHPSPSSRKAFAALWTVRFWLFSVLPRLPRVIGAIAGLLRTEASPSYRGIPKLLYPKLTWKETFRYAYRGALLRSSASKYSMVHANDLRCLIYATGLCGSSGPPILYDSHELNVFRNRANMSWLRIIVNAGFEAAAVARSKVVVTVCDPIARSFERLYGRQDVRVVENRFYSNGQYDVSGSPPAHDAVPAVIYFGGLVPGRGLDRLGAIARDSELACYAVFFGESANQGIRERFGLEAVTVFEQRPGSPLQLPSSLQVQNRLFSWAFIEDVCLSYRYALPNKLFQSLELGLPLIAPDTVSLGKLIQDEGIGLAISARSSPDKIARQIASVTPTEYDAMRSRALKLAAHYRARPLEAVVDDSILATLSARDQAYPSRVPPSQL